MTKELNPPKLQELCQNWTGLSLAFLTQESLNNSLRLSVKVMSQSGKVVTNEDLQTFYSQFKTKFFELYNLTSLSSFTFYPFEASAPSVTEPAYSVAFALITSFLSLWLILSGYTCYKRYTDSENEALFLSLVGCAGITTALEMIAQTGIPTSTSCKVYPFISLASLSIIQG
jgi:hypothetical protein